MKKPVVEFVKPSLIAILVSFILALVIVLILRNLHITNALSKFFFDNNQFFEIVIITPIVEETLKFLGYFYIFIVDVKDITLKAKLKFRYKSNEDFIQQNIIWISLTIGIVFGILEGILYSAYEGNPLIEILPHSLTHAMFIITPVLYFKAFNKNIVLFLPLAIFMHFLNNLRYLLSESFPMIHIISIVLIVIIFIIPIFILYARFYKKYKGKKIMFK